MITQMLWAADAAGPPPLPEVEQWWYFIDALDEKTIRQAGASTAWDITTIGGIERSKSFSADYDSINWLWLNSTGTVLILGGYNTSFSPRWRKYVLSTAWDISTATYDSETYTPADPGNHAWIDSSGTRIYVTVGSVALGSSVVRQYSLSAAWDLSSASLVGTLDIVSLLGWNPGRAGVVLSSTGENFGFFGVDELWDPGPPVVRTAHIHMGEVFTTYDITSGLFYTDWYLETIRGVSGPLEGALPILAMPPSSTAFVVLVGTELRKYSGSTAWDVSLSSYPDGTLPQTEDLSASFASGIISFFAGPAI